MKQRMAIHTGFRSVFVLGALLVGLAAPLLLLEIAGAYAEEPLVYRDPYTGAETEDEVNSIHFDLTYALALAAGFTVEDSKQLMIWDQLVDSEVIGPGETISYTNCGGSFAAPPDPQVVCEAGTNIDLVAWPRTADMQGPTCMTSRFGPFSPFFHFPHVGGQDLQAVYDWSYRPGSQLFGYEAYAWGGVTVLQATCAYTRTMVITTTIPAGSLQAFASYLHVLGDAYSHRECLEALAQRVPPAPWGTHSNPHSENSVYACDYVPSNPQNDDAHGREYGNLWPADSLRTDEGIAAIYAALAERSLRLEGSYLPLDLDAPLAGLPEGQPTLRAALYYFVHTWVFKGLPENPSGPAMNRRDYAERLAQAILDLPRQSIPHIYLPAIVR